MADTEPTMDGGALTNRFRGEIVDALRERKPNAASGTINSYRSALTSLHRKMQPLLKAGDRGHELAFFKKHAAQILKFVNERIESQQTRRVTLSALYAITGDERFQAGIKSLADSIQAEYDKNQYTEKQRANLVTFDEVKDRVAALKAELDASPSAERYMNFLLLALMSGVYVTPRRNEWGVVKIRNYDRKTDNFYKAGVFTFNQYKTAHKFGVQQVTPPPELRAIINRWVRANPTDNMFYNRSGTPLDSPAVNKALQRIFDGKAVGCDMLRHISATEHAKDGLGTVAELRKRAEEAGHSIEQELQYIKR